MLSFVGVLSGCTVLQNFGTTPYYNTEWGLFFRHPSSLSVTEEKGTLVLKFSGKATLTITTEEELLDRPVEATDRKVKALREGLEKEGFKVSDAGLLRVDGQYVKILEARKESASVRIYVAAIPTVLKDYLFRYEAPAAEFSSDVKGVDQIFRTLKFTGNYRLVWATPFWTVTGRNMGAFSMVLLALIILIFLWKDFWVDLYRLVVAPGDVFRDTARGATFLYPLFIVLLTGSLTSARMFQNADNLMANFDQMVMTQAQIQSVSAINQMTKDEDMRQALLYDVRRRALQPYEQMLTYGPYLIPFLVLALWLVYSVSFFLALVILRQYTTFPWVWKGSSFLFVPFFLSGYAGDMAFLSGSAVLYGLAGILFLWGLYLTIVALAEFGHMRRGNAVGALLISVVFIALVVGGVGYYLVQNYAAQAASAFTPDRSLLRGLSV